MPHRHRLITAEIACLLLAVTMAGCACSCPRCAPTTCLGWQPNCSATNPCYGYFSTCWRNWPTECGPCPSFAALGGTGSEILPTPELPLLIPQPVGENGSAANRQPASPTNNAPGGQLPFSPQERANPEEGAWLPHPTRRSAQTPISFRPAQLDNR